MRGVVEGDVVAGKYRVERILGKGGMGLVVAARHVALQEPVAIKLLLPDTVPAPEAVERFLREARAAARIKNEHVVRVSDVGLLENDTSYIVMEYLEGEDLSAHLEKRRTLPIEDAVDYIVQTCEAIAGAHALGIIHRDLKPSNLMLVERSDGSPCIKVLDFGISKAPSSVAESPVITGTATILGSPSYMSPEQMTSTRDVDGRADIWSLGTILYELVIGKPPFMADSVAGLAVMVATVEHRPMQSLRPELDPGLDAVVARCLAKQREDRFENVAELAAALAPFAPERSRASIASAARILGVQLPTATDNPRLRRASSPVLDAQAAAAAVSAGSTSGTRGKRSRFALGAGALLAIAAAAGGALLWNSRRSGPEPVVESAIPLASEPASPAAAANSANPAPIPEPPRPVASTVAEVGAAGAASTREKPAPPKPRPQRPARPSSKPSPHKTSPSAYEQM